MNLRAVDLNLLVILDALLDEAHVSRAAQRLNLSQPAVSSALQRCRDLFGDPLLERGGGGMTRTVKAEALRAPLKTLLGQVTDLLDPPEIPLAEIARTLRIITADDPLSILAAPLVARLQATAPGITLVFQPWRGAATATRHLMDGDADLAISVFNAEAEALRTVTLLEEDYVVAMRRGHPAAAAFGLDAWLAHPHVVVSGRGEARSALDRALAARGRERRVGLVLPSFQMVPRVLAGSDFIAMMPRHSPALREQSGLVTFPPPLAVPGFPLHLAWHERHAKDAAVQHVRAEIAAIFAALPPVSGAT